MDDQTSLLAGARPSFARTRRTRGRVAVIDVGSNSVRLVVFDNVSRAPDYFFNEKHPCGLGARLGETGRLDPEGRAAALATLRRFAALAGRMQVAALDAVATAAVREAEDGAEFAAEVERETGLRLEIVSGEDEARFAAMGVLLGAPGAEGVAVDMGGASMELAALEAGEVGACVTLALGPQRLAGLKGAALEARIDAELARGGAIAPMRGRPAYLVGGAWRCFAKLQMGRAGWPLQVLHGHAISPEAAAEAAGWIAAQSPEALRAAGAGSSRAPTAALAARVLLRILETLRPSELRVSSFGLREGVYFRGLPPSFRRLDPLIEAASRLETRRARHPGFGEELARWIDPALPGWSAGERRLARAACLLHDVNWRAHPDYRAVSCFETMTRANLVGLDHAERVFIGFALMNRYGGGRRSADVEEALALLGPEARARAKALGRGLRLGAMLSGSTPGALGDLPLAAGRRRLKLDLTANPELAGEVVGRRLKGFADALGLEPALRL